MNNKSIKKYRLNSIELLIICSTIILPYTLLRFGIMGFGELFFLLLFLYILLKPINKKWLYLYHFSRFWVIYLFVSIIGFSYNFIVLNHATGTIKGMLFDFGAFMLVLMTCFSLESLINKKRISIYALLRAIFLMNSVTMTILYIISLFTDNIFGLPLKYYHYFAPLADNLHQISMFLVPLPFIGLKVVAVEKSKCLRILAFILILIDAYLAIRTGSTKAYLSLYLGTFFFMILFLYNKFQGRERILFIMLFLIVIISGSGYFFENIYSYTTEFFLGHDIGSGRKILYTDGLEIGFTSPLIGLGTGPHIWLDGKFWDVHQSFVAAFLHAGVIGVLLLSSLFYKSLKRNLKEPAIFAAISTIFLYALGGDILRRLPMWVFMVLLFYYNKKDELIFRTFPQPKFRFMSRGYGR